MSFRIAGIIIYINIVGKVLVLHNYFLLYLFILS